MGCNQVLVKNNNWQEVSPLTTFEACSNFNHPVHHLCAIFLCNIMSSEWISGSSSRQILFIQRTKHLCILYKLFVLQTFLYTLYRLVVLVARLFRSLSLLHEFIKFVLFLSWSLKCNIWLCNIIKCLIHFLVNPSFRLSLIKTVFATHQKLWHRVNCGTVSKRHLFSLLLTPQLQSNNIYWLCRSWTMCNFKYWLWYIFLGLIVHMSPLSKILWLETLSI